MESARLIQKGIEIGIEWDGKKPKIIIRTELNRQANPTGTSDRPHISIVLNDVMIHNENGGPGTDRRWESLQNPGEICPKCGEAVLEREIEYNAQRHPIGLIAGCPNCGEAYAIPATVVR